MVDQIAAETYTVDDCITVSARCVVIVIGFDVCSNLNQQWALKLCQAEHLLVFATRVFLSFVGPRINWNDNGEQAEP